MNIEQLCMLIEQSLQQFLQHRDFYSRESSLQFLMAMNANRDNRPSTIEDRVRSKKIDISLLDIENNSKIGIELKFYFNDRPMGNDQAMNCILDIAKANDILNLEGGSYNKIFVVWIYDNQNNIDAEIKNLFNKSKINLSTLHDLFEVNMERSRYIYKDTYKKYNKYRHMLESEMPNTRKKCNGFNLHIFELQRDA